LVADLPPIPAAALPCAHAGFVAGASAEILGAGPLLLQLSKYPQPVLAAMLLITAGSIVPVVKGTEGGYLQSLRETYTIPEGVFTEPLVSGCAGVDSALLLHQIPAVLVAPMSVQLPAVNCSSAATCQLGWQERTQSQGMFCCYSVEGVFLLLSDCLLVLHALLVCCCRSACTLVWPWLVWVPWC
jgi:hypothetical protein